MSTDLSFSKARREDLPLQIFLKDHHALFAAEPGRLLKPLISYIDGLHRNGGSHGALVPSSIRVSEGGIINLDFLGTLQGSAHNVEAFTYYPNGRGTTPEEQQRNDIEALASVLHLVIMDQPPASRARRVQRLQDQPSCKEWPDAFIALLDRLLHDDAGTPLPTLAELSASLTVEPAPTSEPATEPVMENPNPSPEPGPAASVPTAEPAAAVAAPEAQAAATPAEPVAAAGPAVQPTQEESPPAAVPVPPPAAKPTFPTIRLPNAMVGRELAIGIASLLGPDWPPVSRIEALSGMPAGLELREGELAGTPANPGEFLIKLSIHLLDPDAGRPSSLERDVSLIVNPDPQSLWKNIPSDANGEFWKADEISEALSDGPLAVIGASLRGRSHAHVGSFRDDDMAMSWLPGSQWYSLTVADGAGSSKYSRLGSKVACEKVKAHFTELFSSASGEILPRLVSGWAADPSDSTLAAKVKSELYNCFGTAAINARKAVDDQAAALQATSRDFHTTLITALLHPLPDGRWFVATFSVGDGAAAMVSVPGGQPCLLTRPDGGDFAGQTVFLTMKEALSTYEGIMGRINLAIVPGFEALLLVTDGISDPRFDSDAKLAEPAAWDALWNEIRGAIGTAASPEEAAAAMLRWMGFHSPGHHDDRTVVLATPRLQFPQP